MFIKKSHKLVPFVFKTYATQPRRCNYPSVLYGVLSPAVPVVNLKIFLPIYVRNKFQNKANVKPAHQAKEKGWMDAVQQILILIFQMFKNTTIQCQGAVLGGG